MLLPPYRSGSLDAATMGVFGDFIGGYIGQLISLIGICFLIATFRTEYARAKRERFENRFFQLLQLHRDNVDETEVKEVKGRKVFVLMIREWRWILNIIRYEAQVNAEELTQRQLIEISFLCMFYGVGPNSSRMLRRSLDGFRGTFVDILEKALNSQGLKEEVREEKKLSYLPFEGHQSRLGHYYRHLFQMVRFVEANAPSDFAAQQHMSTIRAQLSTHEQALLLLNSLTPMGSPWWNLNLIERFRLVHNIPNNFFDPALELDPTLLFDKGYFEKPEKHKRPLVPLETPFCPGSYPDGYTWKGPRGS